MHNLNTYFDKIFIVNLDDRTDRWADVVKELDKVGIEPSKGPTEK